MDAKNIIIDKLSPYDVKEKKVVFEEFEIEDNSLNRIKELLYPIAQILELDEEPNCIVIAVKAGSFNMHEAVLALIKNDDILSIGAYASEGLISQHTSEKAINKVKEILEKK